MGTTYQVIIIILGYIVATIIGAYFIKLILSRYEKEIEDSGLKKAGMVIGIIERFLVLTFVLLNQYTAITIIFAAKSIARFNELKDRRLAEYYLIGTLSSISFALVVGIISRIILTEKII